jgi:hypothetical protein
MPGALAVRFGTDSAITPIRHNSISELLSRVKIHVFQHHIAVKRQRIRQRSRQV